MMESKEGALAFLRGAFLPAAMVRNTRVQSRIELINRYCVYDETIEDLQV